MEFEDQVEGFEDWPIAGSFVAMWRCMGLSRMTLADAAGVALALALFYALCWAVL